MGLQSSYQKIFCTILLQILPPQQGKLEIIAFLNICSLPGGGGGGTTYNGEAPPERGTFFSLQV